MFKRQCIRSSRYNLLCKHFVEKRNARVASDAVFATRMNQVQPPKWTSVEACFHHMFVIAAWWLAVLNIRANNNIAIPNVHDELVFSSRGACGHD